MCIHNNLIVPNNIEENKNKHVMITGGNQGIGNF
jgi:hypothetical protein